MKRLVTDMRRHELVVEHRTKQEHAQGAIIEDRETAIRRDVRQNKLDFLLAIQTSRSSEQLLVRRRHLATPLFERAFDLNRPQDDLLAREPARAV